MDWAAVYGMQYFRMTTSPVIYLVIRRARPFARV
jgi:hypothetical protein